METSTTTARPIMVWQNSQTGDVSYWFVNGSQRLSSGYIAEISRLPGRSSAREISTETASQIVVITGPIDAVHIPDGDIPVCVILQRVGLAVSVEISAPTIFQARRDISGDIAVERRWIVYKPVTHIAGLRVLPDIIGRAVVVEVSIGDNLPLCGNAVPQVVPIARPWDAVDMPERGVSVCVFNRLILILRVASGILRNGSLTRNSITIRINVPDDCIDSLCCSNCSPSPDKCFYGGRLHAVISWFAA